MPEPKKQQWDFGEGLRDSPPDLPNQELLERTRQATESVGYRPPAPEQSAEPEKQRPPRPSSKKKAPESDDTRPRGRPRKNRSVALSTKISQEQDDLLKAISADGLVIADIVDEALTVFAKSLVKTGRYKRIPLSEDAINRAKAIADKRS